MNKKPLKERSVSKKLVGVSLMPKRQHYVGKETGSEYDWKKSEVLKWLSEQQDVMEWLMYSVLYGAELIKYDASTNMWSGNPDGKWRHNFEGMAEKDRVVKREGRPSLVNNRAVIDRVMEVMGDKVWGSRELARACSEFISLTSLCRLIKSQCENGVMRHVPGSGKWGATVRVQQARIEVIQKPVDTSVGDAS